MLRIFTTFTAIGAVMISPAFIGSVHAQEVEVEITSEVPSMQDDDALNYFASGVKVEEERAAAQVEQGIEGPAVPARELQYLPETLEIGGKGTAKVKMIDGRMVTETISAPQIPQDQGQAASQGQPAAYNPAPAQPANMKPSEAPKTLDAQLKEKHGNMQPQPAVATQPAQPPLQQQPAQVPAPAAAPQPTAPQAPAPVQTAATPVEASAAATEPASGQGVDQTAIVDRAKGAKINIISNTDTGVKLGQ